MVSEAPKQIDFLSIREIPSLAAGQLRFFTLENLHANKVGRFNPHAAQGLLQTREGERVIAIDLGGDKVTTSSFTIQEGRLEPIGQPLVDQSAGGANYLTFLKEVAEEAARHNMPVGLSIAGPLRGTLLQEAPNAPEFTKEFDQEYGRDFAALFQNPTVDNDAVAGMKAAAVEAIKRYPKTTNVLYLINGSGFGAAVLLDELIYATEPGHISVAQSLNPHNQEAPCGVFGNLNPCIEGVVAGKAGIEALYEKATGEKRNGLQISEAYQHGDELALELYDSSARGIAHVVKGMGDAFRLFEEPNITTIVCHGGVFKVPGYGKRLKQIIERYLEQPVQFVLTKDFSQNACLDGAAVAALTSQ